MKKFILALCLCVLSVCAIAQQSSRPGRGPRRMADAVVDTAVINQMQLAPEMVASILQLQETKQEEMKAMMQEGRGQRGHRMSDEEREAMKEKRQAFTQQYRAQLREMMGTETYVTYLEKMLDNRQMFGMAGRPGQRNQSSQRPDFQGGPDLQPGQMPMGGGFDGGF